MSRILTSVLATTLALGLGGCSAEPSAEAAAQAATRFVQAVTNDPGTACALLAPETRKELEESEETSCEQGLAEQGLPTGAGESRGVEVAGHTAQVKMSDQTLFLALFDGGWRVVAAGCTKDSPDSSRPYSCLVKGS